MAQVPEKVLAWLYSVLQDFQDPQRTYSDGARTLSIYPTLSPRTEVYTYDNGTVALLLTLSGTLPVAFRGTTYRFPIKLWIPQAYPQEPPMVYVTPGRDMVIRPGQHVGVDGRVYHPYLRDWSGMWDRASVGEFLEFLQQVFAKEPPVINKAQQAQFQRPIGGQQQQARRPVGQQQGGDSAAPPQLPPKQRGGSIGTTETGRQSAEMPPPRPPKPGDEYASVNANSYPPRTSSRSIAGDGPPPPPLPPQVRQQSSQHEALPQQQNGYNGYGAQPRPLSHTLPPQIPSDPNGRPVGPPLPPLPALSGHLAQPQPTPSQCRPPYERSPVSPVSPINGYSELPETRYPQPPPVQQQQRQYQQPPQPGQQYSQQAPTYQQPYQQPPPLRQYPPGHLQSQQYLNQQPLPPKSQPPPDLLSDPFDVALPGTSQSGPPAPAPPIPPNPEKEHLLDALSTTLVQQARQKVTQNLSALSPLQAQQHALLAARTRLESEIHQLSQLEQTLASNESILHRSIQDCDHTISSTKSKPPPPIDEVLVATSMVAQQLWTLCAEEAACKEAMYVLQKAVDRGRVGGEGFVRQMRSLGRERFLKMVVARKCARGLGLEIGGR